MVALYVCEGFGSMLRSIGAQIEKTTNREACRDLSGRRMRDINNEKRFVNAKLGTYTARNFHALFLVVFYCCCQQTYELAG